MSGKWVLNLCYFKPEKYEQYYGEVDAEFDDDDDDDDEVEEEEDVSGGEDDYKEEKDGNRRNALGRNQYSNRPKPPQNKKERAILAVQAFCRKVRIVASLTGKRKRPDSEANNENDESDDDDDTDEEEDEEDMDGNGGDDDGDDSDDSDNMSVLSSSTTRSRGAGSGGSGKKLKRSRGLTAAQRRELAAAAALHAGDSSPRQDAGVLEAFLIKLLRREDASLPYCLDEDYVAAFCPQAAAQSFPEYSLPGNDFLLRDILGMDASIVETASTPTGNDLMRIGLTGPKVFKRLSAFLRAGGPSVRTVAQLVAFIVAHIGAGRLQPEFCASLNSALEPTSRSQRAAVSAGTMPLSQVTRRRLIVKKVKTSGNDDDDDDNEDEDADDEGVQDLSTDLPGACELWSEVLRRVNWSEAANTSSVLPPIDLSAFSDEALQHVYRMMVGHRLINAKFEDTKENRSWAQRGKPWRSVLQRLQLLPLPALFRPQGGPMTPLISTQLDSLSLLKRKRQSSSLFSASQLDPSSNTATTSEVFAFAHTLTLGFLSSAPPVVKLDVKEDIILALRPAGRVILIRDEVLEKERQMGLYDGPEWQHRAGKRGPKFAREKNIANSSSSGGGSSSGGADVDAPPDGSYKRVTDMQTGFFAREVNRLTIAAPRPMDTDEGQEEEEDDDDEGEQVDLAAAWEAHCPWLSRPVEDGPFETNAVLLNLLAGRALGHLGTFPGSTVASIHGALSLLSPVQTACLLRLLERRRLVVCKVPQQAVACDPFAWPRMPDLAPPSAAVPATFFLRIA